MTTNQKGTEPYFKTVFYKGVELFVHRDESKKPVQLRLYNALSGWVIAAGMTKAEARYQGIKNRIEGKNEEELIQITSKLKTSFMSGCHLAKAAKAFKTFNGRRHRNANSAQPFSPQMTRKSQELLTDRINRIVPER